MKIFKLEWWMNHETLTVILVTIFASLFTSICLNILLLTKLRWLLELL
ncbi:hypothetical protein J2S01_001826 [Pectinatus haikarae]|uniref:Uncharacterized protein n=1 Tax=Pectinatus haikarae TaxID=349096 RepID=A0ABT9YAH4_9FIRM|nr:hypothetical protein [Pectinatus haikarae]